MSHYDYIVSQQLSATDPPFYALIMAAMRKADSLNARTLQECFPGVHAEFVKRYHAPGGRLPEEVTP
jgi:hypothetical protein